MDFFDYYIPATLAGQIRPGVFVKIPFKKQTLIGIVHSLKDKTEFAGAKEIIGVAEEYGELSETQFALIIWFARYYYYSLGSTADLIFPAPLKRRVNIREQAPKTPFSNFIKPDKSATALAARVFNEKNKKYLLFPYNQAKKDGFFVSLCETAVKKQETLLILFPQVAKVEAFFHCLPQSVRAATIIFTADAQAAKAKHWRDWQAVRSGEKRVILGTRSAVFAPLPERSLVVVDDAHSDDYKQWDQNPRYEVINVARQLCDLNNGKIILSSVCPRVEDAAMAQKEKYLSITMPAFGSTDITIVDIRQNKDFSLPYVSVALIDGLRELEQSGKRGLIIVNKKGEYGYLVCADCGHEALCPQCDLPFSVSGSELVCFRCKLKQDMPLVCPECHGANLRKLGAGIEQIEKQLSSLTRAKLIVSTGQNLADSDFNGIGLLAFVYIDSLVFLADFNANARLNSFLCEIIYRTRSASVNLPVILQTAFPENTAIVGLRQGYSQFFNTEMASRQTFNYPPYVTLIKLFYEHHDAKVCATEANRLHAVLLDKIETAGGRLSAPFWYYAKKVRYRYRQQMALFLPNLSLQAENELMANVPEYWTIDKNPISLL